MLARQAAAAVGVGTYWPSESGATLPSGRRREALRRRRGRRGAGAYRGGRRPTACFYFILLYSRTDGGLIRSIRTNITFKSNPSIKIIKNRESDGKTLN